MEYVPDGTEAINLCSLLSVLTLHVEVRRGLACASTSAFLRLVCHTVHYPNLLLTARGERKHHCTAYCPPV